MDEAEAAAAIARYAWFEDWTPTCFTLIEGVDEDEAIHRFGGDPASAELHGPDYYWELTYDHPYLLQTGTARTGHVFAIEESGWIGQYVHPSLTHDGGRAFTIYQHLNGTERIVYTVNGHTLIDEEPRRWLTPWGPLAPLSAPEADPAWDPAWYEGLTGPSGEVWLGGARQMALAERVMGVRIEHDWFRMPLRTVLLPPVEQNPMVSFPDAQ